MDPEVPGRCVSGNKPRVQIIRSQASTDVPRYAKHIKTVGEGSTTIIGTPSTNVHESANGKLVLGDGIV